MSKPRNLKKSGYLFSLIVLAVLFLHSCNRIEPPLQYPYEKAPKLTWGFAEFYGDYYSNYDIENNVISLHLFSENLFITEGGELAGHGQYLIIEDLFIAPTDTILPTGEYKTAETGETYSFFKGEKFKDGYETIPSGAYMYYMESNPLHSKIVYVETGDISVNINYEKGTHTLVGKFTLDDKTSIEATFEGELPHFDQLANPPAGVKRRQSIKFQLPLMPD